MRDLSQAGLLIAQAVQGRSSAEGIDARGVPVIGVARLIPDSDWLLASRMDCSEIYAPLRQGAWKVGATIMALIGAIGFVAARLWRRRQEGLVHDRLSAELEQKRTAARLGAVLRHANDMIFILDHDLRILEANQRAVEVYGWSVEEFRQMTARDLRAPDAREFYERDAASAHSPAGSIFETEHRRKDGTTIPVELSTRTIDIDGRPHVLAIIRDITDRRRAEMELRRAEEMYRTIYEGALEGIYRVSADGKGLAGNPAMLRLLGYDPTEAGGLAVTGAASQIWQDPEARERMVQLLETQGIVRNYECRLKRRDGTPIWVSLNARRVTDPDGNSVFYEGFVNDITERMQAREALIQFNAELEQRVADRTAELAARNQDFQALLDAMPDTVLLCDDHGALVFARSMRYPEVSSLVTGERLSTRRPVLEQVILGIVREMHAAVTAGSERVVREFECTLENGRISILEARANPIGAGRVLILLRDITDRKRVERDMLANLERERQLSEMKSRFVSVASHEFRTPLAAAVGSLELLERHGPRLTEGKRADLLARARVALGRLTTIVGDVLNLSRAESGRVTVNRMAVDAVRFVQDVIREAESGDGGKHQFVFERTGTAETVPADTNLLHHILSNLIGNAVRYSPAGSTVTVSLALGAEEFALTIADQGIGIPTAERERIFEPFVRGTNVGQIAGTGLGLNIVKRYIELMGGRIELVDADRGTTFRVHVPLNQPAS